MSLSTIPTDSNDVEKTSESDATGGARAALMLDVWRPKNSQNMIWGYCNPLKFHKTAKGNFGNPWRKQAWIWKSLAKKLGASRRRPERRRAVASRNPGPNRVRLRLVIVIVLTVSLD
jgi:hypothetical protein